MIPLARNESYWLLDDALLEAARSFGPDVLSTYPEYGQFKERLATYAGVAPEQLSLMAGSDASIALVAEVLVGRGARAVLPVPTFYGYESILERAGVVMVPVTYTEQEGADGAHTFVFPLQPTLDALASGDTRAVFLCHPNNPLGCPIPDDALAAILDAAAAHDAYVISDEAYFEFSGRTLLPQLASHPKLILIRTLSKGFGLSGARVGYVIASPEVTATLQKQLLPWPVAHAALFAADALVARADAVAARRALVIQAREDFLSALREVPKAMPYPSETNFVLVRVPDAQLAAGQLRENGINVATGEWMSRFPEAKQLLANVLRIAVPAPEHAGQVIDILHKI